MPKKPTPLWGVGPAVLLKGKQPKDQPARAPVKPETNPQAAHRKSMDALFGKTK